MKSKLTFQSRSIDARLASKASAQEVVDLKSRKTIIEVSEKKSKQGLSSVFRDHATKWA